jgi:hypothetical protein
VKLQLLARSAQEHAHRDFLDCYQFESLQKNTKFYVGGRFSSLLRHRIIYFLISKSIPGCDFEMPAICCVCLLSELKNANEPSFTHQQILSIDAEA